MTVTYSKLWKKCIDKQVTKMQLKEAAHISYNAIAKMGKNEPVSLETLEKICRVLECNVGDIIEFDIDQEGDSNE
jgi:putative transcriptional regulator